MMVLSLCAVSNFCVVFCGFASLKAFFFQLFPCKNVLLSQDEFAYITTVLKQAHCFFICVTTCYMMYVLKCHFVCQFLFCL